MDRAWKLKKRGKKEKQNKKRDPFSGEVKQTPLRGSTPACRWQNDKSAARKANRGGGFGIWDLGFFPPSFRPGIGTEIERWREGAGEGRDGQDGFSAGIKGFPRGFDAPVSLRDIIPLLPVKIQVFPNSGRSDEPSGPHPGEAEPLGKM